MKEILKAMIQEKIKASFVPEYQAQVTDADALGLILSHYFEYDGLAILKTAYAALEDANFHTENREIEKLIRKLESQP